MCNFGPTTKLKLCSALAFLGLREEWDLMAVEEFFAYVPITVFFEQKVQVCLDEDLRRVVWVLVLEDEDPGDQGWMVDRARQSPTVRISEVVSDVLTGVNAWYRGVCLQIKAVRPWIRSLVPQMRWYIGSVGFCHIVT